MTGYYLGSPYVATVLGSVDVCATDGCKATSQIRRPQPRPHDEHCAECDAEEFMAVKYGTYHRGRV